MPTPQSQHLKEKIEDFALVWLHKLYFFFKKLIKMLSKRQDVEAENCLLMHPVDRNCWGSSREKACQTSIKLVAEIRGDSLSCRYKRCANPRELSHDIQKLWKPKVLSSPLLQGLKHLSLALHSAMLIYSFLIFRLDFYTAQ